MKPRLASAFLSVLFGPFGVFCLGWGILTLVRGEVVTALVALGFGVFMVGFVAVLLIVGSRRLTPRSWFDEEGTTIRPDVIVDRTTTVATFGVFAAMALYAIFAPLDMVNIPLPRADRQHFVIGCAAAVLIGLPSLWQIIRQRGTSHVRMTADGLAVGTMTSTKKLGWDQVTDISDRPRNGRQPTGSTYLTTSDGRTRTVVSGWYTPGGDALREILCFYWRHPEHRGEFVDGRAVERLG